MVEIPLTFLTLSYCVSALSQYIESQRDLIFFQMIVVVLIWVELFKLSFHKFVSNTIYIWLFKRLELVIWNWQWWFIFCNDHRCKHMAELTIKISWFTVLTIKLTLFTALTIKLTLLTVLTHQTYVVHARYLSKFRCLQYWQSN